MVVRVMVMVVVVAAVMAITMVEVGILVVDESVHHGGVQPWLW
jgi:hypothetical protein